MIKFDRVRSFFFIWKNFLKFIMEVVFWEVLNDKYDKKKIMVM